MCESLPYKWRLIPMVKEVCDFACLAKVDNVAPTSGNIKPEVQILVDFFGGSIKTIHYKYVGCVTTYDDAEGELVVDELSSVDDEGIDFECTGKCSKSWNITMFTIAPYVFFVF